MSQHDSDVEEIASECDSIEENENEKFSKGDIEQRVQRQVTVDFNESNDYTTPHHSSDSRNSDSGISSAHDFQNYEDDLNEFQVDTTQEFTCTQSLHSLNSTTSSHIRIHSRSHSNNSSNNSQPLSPNKISSCSFDEIGSPLEFLTREDVKKSITMENEFRKIESQILSITSIAASSHSLSSMKFQDLRNLMQLLNDKSHEVKEMIMKYCLIWQDSLKNSLKEAIKEVKSKQKSEKEKYTRVWEYRQRMKNDTFLNNIRTPIEKQTLPVIKFSKLTNSQTSVLDILNSNYHFRYQSELKQLQSSLEEPFKLLKNLHDDMIFKINQYLHNANKAILHAEKIYLKLKQTPYDPVQTCRARKTFESSHNLMMRGFELLSLHTSEMRENFESIESTSGPIARSIANNRPTIPILYPQVLLRASPEFNQVATQRPSSAPSSFMTDLDVKSITNTASVKQISSRPSTGKSLRNKFKIKNMITDVMGLCPVCQCGFAPPGKIIPTTASLSYQVRRQYHEQWNDKLLQLTTSTNMTVKQKHEILQQQHLRQLYNHQPGKEIEFCSWECVKRWVRKNHPIQHRYTTELLIDTAAGHIVDVD